MNREVLKARLRKRLEDLGKTMKEASLEAGLGQTFARDILGRDIDPGVTKLASLARALDTSVSYLLGEVEHPEVSPSNKSRVAICRLEHGTGLPLPAQHNAEAAGFDLAAAVPANEPLALAPGARALVPSGFAVELPAGYEAQVRPRSGLAHKHGITVLNAPGTIDADYRGEVKVLLVNLGTETFLVERGMRIAQMVVQPVPRVSLVEVEDLNDSTRGSGGFGSTGTG